MDAAFLRALLDAAGKSDRTADEILEDFYGVLDAVVEELCNGEAVHIPGFCAVFIARSDHYSRRGNTFPPYTYFEASSPLRFHIKHRAPVVDEVHHRRQMFKRHAKIRACIGYPPMKTWQAISQTMAEKLLKKLRKPASKKKITLDTVSKTV